MLSTGELCLRLGRSRFYVFKMLYEAYQKGLVALDEQSSMPADPGRNEPVDLLFALAVPENCSEDHLKLLAQVAELFSDPKLLTQLREAEGSGKLLKLLSTTQSRTRH